MKNYFEEDKYRFVILGLTALVSTILSCINYSFSPISKSLKSTISASDYDIYYLSVSYSISFVLFSFPASYLIDTYGVRPSLIFCLTLQSLGSFIRIFITNGIFFALLGQTISAIGNPFGNNVIGKVSVNWFKPENRMISTAILTSSYMFGVSLAFGLASLIVNDINEETISDNLSSIKTLMIVVFLISLIILFLVFFFYREKPDLPTSFVSNYPRENFTQALKMLLKNKDFNYLCIGFSFLLTSYVLFVTFISNFLSPFNLTEKQIGIIGFSFNLSTFFGKIAVGFITGKYISYKNSLIWICVICMAFLGFLIISLFHENFTIILVFSILFGFFLQMYWAPCLEFACELVFPIGEASANGSLVLSGCISNMIFGFLASAYFDSQSGDGGKYNIFIFFVCFLISGASFLKVEENLKREQKEIEMIIAEKFQQGQIH